MAAASSNRLPRDDNHVPVQGLWDATNEVVVPFRADPITGEALFANPTDAVTKGQFESLVSKIGENNVELRINNEYLSQITGDKVEESDIET